MERLTWVENLEGLDVSEKAVLFVLAKHWDSTGKRADDFGMYSPLRQREIAKRTGIKKRETVNRILKRLKEKGLIEFDRQPEGERRPNQYRLTPSLEYLEKRKITSRPNLRVIDGGLSKPQEPELPAEQSKPNKSLTQMAQDAIAGKLQEKPAEDSEVPDSIREMERRQAEVLEQRL